MQGAERPRYSDRGSEAELSVLRQVWLSCDICGDECELTRLTVVEARSAAKSVGWLRDRDYGDVCPACQKRAENSGE